MPITSNEGGVLYELETITVNEGGVLYPLDTVSSNEGGVLYEIFSAKTFPKALTWMANASSYGSVTNNGLECTAVYKSSLLRLSLYFTSTKIGTLIPLLNGDQITLEIISTSAKITYGYFYLKTASQDYSDNTAYKARAGGLSELTAGSKLTLTVPSDGNYNLVIALSTVGTVAMKISFK